MASPLKKRKKGALFSPLDPYSASVARSKVASPLPASPQNVARSNVGASVDSFKVGPPLPASALTSVERSRVVDIPIPLPPVPASPEPSVVRSKVASPGPTCKCVVFDDSPQLATCTDEEFARAMHNFLFKHREDRGCCRVSAPGCGPLECRCLSNFMGKVKMSGPTQDSSFSNYEQTFLMIARILRLIIKEPEKDNTVAMVCDHLTLFFRQSNRNGTPQLLLHSPDENVVLCFNGLFELGGHKNKKFMKRFYSKYLTNPKLGKKREEANPKWYTVSKVIYPKQFYQLAYLAVIDLIIEDGVSPILASAHFPANRIAKCIDASDWLSGEQSFVALFIQRYAREMNIMLDSFGPMLIVSHPNVPNSGVKNCYTVDQDCVSGSRIFALAATWSYKDALRHEVDAGVFQVNMHRTLFFTILEHIEKTAGFAGRDGKLLLSVSGNNSLRYLSPFDHDREGLQMLLEELKVSKDVIEERGLHSETTKFGELASKACVALLPHWLSHSPDGRPIRFGMSLSAGVMISAMPTLVPMDDTWNSQFPHLDHQVEKLMELQKAGIHAFLGFLPLKREGSFLRVWPELDEDNVESKKGKLLYLMENCLTIVPATMIHAGGFRTSVRGNPRMHFFFFLIPSDMCKEQAKKVLPTEPFNAYIGDCGLHGVLPVFPKPTTEGALEYHCPQLSLLHQRLGF
jgi:hypothetical protein